MEKINETCDKMYKINDVIETDIITLMDGYKQIIIENAILHEKIKQFESKEKRVNTKKSICVYL